MDNTDANYIEGSAAWMEDEVYDSVNDNVQYLWPYRSRAWGHTRLHPDWYRSGSSAGTHRAFGTTVAGGAENVIAGDIREHLEGAGAAPCNPERVLGYEHIPFDYVFISSRSPTSS